ncbi:MAG TPA: VWA domain-containing protein, partial [Gemmatimonadaceae bacterium]
RYIEERELTVMLVVDLSGSERFGTVKRFKSELASELAAVLAMSAIRNNDRVGVLLFTDRVEHVIPPRKGRRHVLRIIRDLLAFEPVGRGTDMVTAIDYVARMLNEHAIVFIVSDFLEADIDHPLKLLAQRHDVVAVTVEDPSERLLPDIGVARLIDPETGETFEVDTSSPLVRDSYSTRVSAERETRKHLLRRLAIDEVAVRTEAGVVEPLLRFFRARETRSRRR